MTHPTHLDVIGHEEAIENLNMLYKSGTFPHAVLLYGPQGIGKRRLAEKTASTLMCGAEGEKLSPNFLSPIYAQIQEGVNADYHILEPEKGKKSISIDQTRGLLKKISLSSDTARVIIVDAAENMTSEAANALLKTLEEPQKNVHFFLVCHQISKILPTIVSRCRPVRLTPLSDEDTATILRQEVDTSETNNVTELTKLAKGCPGMAIAALEENLLPLQQEIERFLSAPQSPLIFTESIAKKKQIPAALDLLQKALGQDMKWHQVHQNLSADVARMNTLNLTPAWVLEKSLRDICASNCS